MNEFSPFVQITLAGERLAVMFDSQCAEDVTRRANVVFVPRSADALSWEISDESAEGRVEIKLLVTLDDGVKRHDLATVSVPSGTASSVRQAFSSAFQAALAAYLQREQGGPAVQGQSAALTPGASSATAPSDTNASRVASRPSMRRSVAILAIIGLVGFAVTYAMSGHSGRSVDPIKAAVAQNMAQDPASIMAQVELTKETLRSMGLDPGRAGDLGCLAAQ